MKLSSKPIKLALRKVPVLKKLFPKKVKVAERKRRLLSHLPLSAVGAEIGVHEGMFSEGIVQLLQPRLLLLIDPWRYETDPTYEKSWYGGDGNDEAELEKRFAGVKEKFAAEIASGGVQVIRQPSAEALAELEDNSLDFVYIDGNHLYEFVKEDLELSLEKVKPGGFIAGDDYGPGGWWEGGVKRAVDELGWNRRVSLVVIDEDQFLFRKNE